ncbi:hypothetical protein P8452_57329 [Trifolium repens]|nr:hypothetical protein P8452_57329 [Trifolium repens]
MAGTWHPTLSSAGEIWQRKNTKGKRKVKNESKQATQAPAADAPEGSQNQATQAPAADAPEGSQSQATQAPPAVTPTQAPEATQSEAPEAIEASQLDTYFDGEKKIDPRKKKIALQLPRGLKF